MNEKQAALIAIAKGLAVSKTKVAVLPGRFWFNTPAKRYELKVGDATCFYETDTGGAACWKVEYQGQVFKAHLKATAIIKAVELQAVEEVAA